MVKKFKSTQKGALLAAEYLKENGIEQEKKNDATIIYLANKLFKRSEDGKKG